MTVPLFIPGFAHPLYRRAAMFLSDAFVRVGGAAKYVWPDGAERGPLTPRVLATSRFQPVSANAAHADMAVRAPLCFQRYTVKTN